MAKFPIPVLGFAAFSGTGKTTLLKKVLPLLKAQGLRVAVVKHAHHNFEVDQSGKDSYELRKAGASPMLVCSSQRLALMLDYDQSQEPNLEEMIDFLPLHRLDAVLVEGFKSEAFDKIELHRPAMGKPLLAETDTNIIAIATNQPKRIAEQCPALPRLDLGNAEQITAFVITQIEQQRQTLQETCHVG